MNVPEFVRCPAVGTLQPEDSPGVITCPECGRYATVEDNGLGDPAIYDHNSNDPRNRAAWLLAPVVRRHASAALSEVYGDPDWHDTQTACALVDALLAEPDLLADLAQVASGTWALA